ncbi:PPE domain-containing protein [Nocardia thailandica]
MLGYVGKRVTDLFTDDINPTSSEKDAQTVGNDARNRLYAENGALGQGFTGEYSAPVLVNGVMEPFLDMPHAEIMKFIDSIKLNDMNTSVQGWKTLAQDTTAKATTFHDNVAKEMQRGWSGSAADSALASVKSYLGDVHRVDQAASLIANKMEEAYTGFQQVYYQVPQPSEGRSGGILASGVSIVANSILPGAGSATDWFISGTDARRTQNAQDEANEVMRTVYKPVALQADTNVPKVPLPTTPQAKPDSDIPGNNGDGSGSGKPTGTTPSGTNPTTNPTTTENPTDTTTENPTTTDDTDNDDDTSTNPSSTTPQSTTPENTNPTTPNGTNPAGTNPAGTNPTGSGGPGSGSPGSGTPGAGKSIPGTGQQNPTAAGAGTTAAAGTARSGMSGMGGMGAPGRGGGKEDESEHNAPDWLRRVYEELLGPDEKHVPPVIGGDA